MTIGIDKSNWRNYNGALRTSRFILMRTKLNASWSTSIAITQALSISTNLWGHSEETWMSSDWPTYNRHIRNLTKTETDWWNLMTLLRSMMWANIQTLSKARKIQCRCTKSSWAFGTRKWLMELWHSMSFVITLGISLLQLTLMSTSLWWWQTLGNYDDQY
jgi:hypothetical protein